MNTSSKKTVSVIIPTKNESKNLEEALNSLKKSGIPPTAEIIVVDAHSTDNTVEIATNYGIRVLYEDSGTRGGACNIGWRNGQGDIIIYTDADCLFTKGWINSILKHFDDYEVSTVGGADLNPPRVDSYFEESSGLLDELRIGSNIWRGSSIRPRGCNVAYRKSALLRAGGFDEKFVTGEEIDLQFRLHKLGYKTIFDPSIRVYHKRRPSLSSYCKQFRRYGFGAFQEVKKHPSFLLLPKCLPAYVMLMLGFSFFLSVINRMIHPLLIITVLIPIIYLTYVLFRILAYKRSVKILPGVIFAFIIRNLSFAIGFFEGFFGFFLKKRILRG
jgi:cellulose synthase/poly-beta-1,6-N-acetylglucosamine synthase-like glycosyltransferase